MNKQRILVYLPIWMFEKYIKSFNSSNILFDMEELLIGSFWATMSYLLYLSIPEVLNVRLVHKLRSHFVIRLLTQLLPQISCWRVVIHYMLTDYLLAFLGAAEMLYKCFKHNFISINWTNALFLSMGFYLVHLTTFKECVWTVTQRTF